MVVAVKQAWSGQVVNKAAGAPNMSPFFFASSQLGSTYQNMVQLRPGQYHTWVHAACQAIIQPTIDLPVVMYKKGKEDTLIEEHPILDLMRNPNPFMSGTNFYEAILWHLLTNTVRTPGGQAFVVGEKPTNFKKGEIPQELWVFGDEAMSPIVDKQNILVGWKLGMGGGHTTTEMILNLDQVIRINLFNKYDLKLGLSPLSAVMIEVDQDAKAKEYNTRFLENGASAGGMVSLDGAPPDKQIWESLKTQFAQQHAGFQNAGKTMFMPWMLKFEQFAKSHVDFAYMEQLAWNKDSILAAYRVNKWAVGDSKDLNYATSKEATRQLYERAIKPIMRTMFTELNEGWIRFIDKRDLRIKADLSQVEALKEDRALKIRDASILIADGLPPAAAWEYVGLDIETDPFPWLKENLSGGALMASATGDNPDKPVISKPVEANKPPDEKPAKPKAALIVITKDERENLSKFYVDKIFNPGEKELLPVVTKFMISQRNAMQEFAKEILKGSASPKDLTAASFLMPKNGEDSKIIRAFQPIFMSQVKRTLRQLHHDLPKKALDLDSTEDEINAFLKSRLLSLSEINDTSFSGVEDQLSQIITDGIDQNQTMDELGHSIHDGIFDVYQGRLKRTGTIARTETATVTSGVRFEVFKTNKIQRQEWLTAHDSRVRDSHKEEDGHIIKVGDKFPVTHLHYPSDKAGPPEETISCRCVALPVEEE